MSAAEPLIEPIAEPLGDATLIVMVASARAAERAAGPTDVTPDQPFRHLVAGLLCPSDRERFNELYVELVDLELDEMNANTTKGE